MEMIGNEFLDRFHHYIHQWWPARALLEKAIAKRFEVRLSSYTISSRSAIFISRLIHLDLFLLSIVHFHGVNIYSISKMNNRKLSVIKSNMFSIPMQAKPGVSKPFPWIANHSLIVYPYLKNGKVYATKN